MKQVFTLIKHAIQDVFDAPKKFSIVFTQHKSVDIELHIYADVQGEAIVKAYSILKDTARITNDENPHRYKLKSVTRI